MEKIADRSDSKKSKNTKKNCDPIEAFEQLSISKYNREMGYEILK